MAYDPGAIEATLAAAVGDDPGLIADLRIALVDSAQRVLAAMATATTSDEWRASAWRLRGLAASFGATRLMTLATQAMEVGAADPAMLGQLTRVIARL